MDTSTARAWIQRWDAQQERYVPDREERFEVVIDIVETVSAGVPEPVVVDLACGPGSLSDRLARRLPGARITGVDADSLLLALGNADLRPNVRLLHADLTSQDWLAEIDGPWDAAVSSTALHWLERGDLAELYRTVAARLRPGGVFVNADHLPVEPALCELAEQVYQRRTTRAGVDGNEEWRAWWDALRADQELAPLLDERTVIHSEENSLSAAEHTELLRAAGFSAVAPLWQFGNDHVLVAVR